MLSTILIGIIVGSISGIVIGLVMLISDGIFYSRYIDNFELARKYSNPINQILIFAFISIFYGAIQGAIFSWLSPLLPTGWFLKGLTFGIISYLILSRHFVEGAAFMSPKHFPQKLTLYLSIEFLTAYILQGLLISIIFNIKHI